MKRWVPVLASVAVGVTMLYQLAAVINIAAISGQASMTIIDLGTLGGETSHAADLNEQRQVAGSSTLSPTAKFQGFLWSKAEMKQLEVTAELPTFAFAVNEQGQVVGAAVTGPDASLDQRPVLWQDDTFVPLELDNTLQGSARAINDQGQIAGQTLDASANDLLIWQEDGGTYPLTSTIPFSDGFGQVNSMNNQGQIVGLIADGDAQRAFLWEAGEFHDLQTLGGTQSTAYDINELGQIAGSSSTSEELASHATLWVDGAPQDLGTLDDSPEAGSRALGLNNKGVVVGEAAIGGETHAVLWAGSQIFDLNDFLPEDSPWDMLQTAVRINDIGWIAGTGLQGGQERAFLMYVPTEKYEVYLPVVTGSQPPVTPTSTPSPTASPTSTPSPTPTPSATPPGIYYDMMRFMGDGRLYEVKFTGPNGSSQSRHQTQTTATRFYHTKGNEFSAEWEELWIANNLLYRGTDTSPGNDMYYSLYDNQALGSAWSPRYWKVGGLYYRQPLVIFYYKANCQIVTSGVQTSWLKFEQFLPSFTPPNLGVPIKNVVQLAWYLGGSNGPVGSPIERYYYGEGYGLVAWQSLTQGYSSSVSEVFQPGQRPDNKREVIPCLQNSMLQTLSLDDPALNFGPLPEPYASMARPLR